VQPTAPTQPTRITTRLVFTREVVRAAVRAYLWRTVGTRFWVVCGALLVYLCVRLASGDRSWYVGALGAIVVIALAFPAFGYRVQLRHGMARLEAMGTPEATLELGDERLRIASGAGAAEFPWSEVKQVWRRDQLWLVELKAGGYFTLPLSGVDGEALRFLVERVSAAGGKVA
jgi:hypothetical protein